MKHIIITHVLTLFSLFSMNPLSGQEKMKYHNFKEIIDKKAHIIILSPHIDDGIWSVGGTIARAEQNGCLVNLITSHTGNPVDEDVPRAQMKELTKNGSMEERKSEDSLASDVLNISPIWWDIPSRLYRKPWLKKRTYLFKTPHGNEIVNNDRYLKLEKRSFRTDISPL